MVAGVGESQLVWWVIRREGSVMGGDRCEGWAVREEMPEVDDETSNHARPDNN